MESENPIAHLIIVLILFGGCIWIGVRVFKDERRNGSKEAEKIR